MDTHRVIGTMHCDEGIQIGVFYLNHRIDAPKARIRPDGDGREWRSDQALFIGSDSPTETILPGPVTTANGSICWPNSSIRRRPEERRSGSPSSAADGASI